MRVLVLSVFLSTVGTFAADAVPQVGRAAAGLTVPSQDGSKVSVRDFKGRRVVLYFYPKDGTQGCTIEAHNFERSLSQHEKKPAVIVGVSVDLTRSHQECCAKQGLTSSGLRIQSKTSLAVRLTY